MFFIHGDADGIRLDHIAEMYRLKGGRSTRRHAAAPGIETGYFARHNTRYADEPHDNNRPDGERLSRCEARKAIARSGLCCKVIFNVHEADRMEIAQRFMRWVDARFKPESVKRTTERPNFQKTLTQPSATDFDS